MRLRATPRPFPRRGRIDGRPSPSTVFPITSRRSIAIFKLLVAVVAGCEGAEKSYEDTARETFSKEQSCPLDRLSARQRKDLDAYETVWGKDEDPAAEIKNDPGRYAVWKKQRDETHAQYNKATTLVEVKGCNHESLYSCAMGTQMGANGPAGPVNVCSLITPRATAAPTPAPMSAMPPIEPPVPSARHPAP
jgi:hypothetical protein